MFDKVLIANRGAIAVRIQRTLHRMGIASVAVYTRADADSLHVRQADEAVCIGDALAAESYLDIGKVVAAARATGAQAIHPGYGFLSENLEFAAACEAAGIAFIGPAPEQIRAFGLKHTARELAERSGVPMLPGSGLLDGLGHALGEAARIGYPVMLKSTAGGGGIGMQRCHAPEQLEQAWASVRRLSQNNFGNDGLFLEKLVERARHIEVQVFGDGQGRVVALGERDCSLQRRNQKVVEETPAPNLPQPVREAMWATAVRLGEAVGYRSAGTVEYIYDDREQRFYFLEVNTRLQVEHGVTEETTGVDLVEWMVRLAAGERGFLDGFRYVPQGHAIQVRLYAEDPALDFRPVAGRLTRVVTPAGGRCDTWVASGTEVAPYYDPMLAKLIAHGGDREQARRRLAAMLEQARVDGIETNLDYLRQVLAASAFVEGRQTTADLNRFAYAARGIEVLEAGTQSTVQDWPGRTGYWDVGVPPSGPFDSLALRLGNRVLGNPEGAAGLEMTLAGATLRFREAATVAIAGADMAATLDGAAVPLWQALEVPAGAVLAFDGVRGAGARTYLCVRGGLDVPDYLGSASTFTLGRFGGHGGRALQPGDVLRIGAAAVGRAMQGALPAGTVPAYAGEWTFRTVYGPHGAPDFFTDEDIATFFATAWEVHYNSSRTGVRLIGPKPQWARPDGGEAGLHPSNLHDNAYAVGAVDFTGDMPVILGPDGPSLGGFACPVTIVKADLWQLGQLRAGDRVRFVPVAVADADVLERAQHARVEGLRPVAVEVPALAALPPSPVLARGEDGPFRVVYRPSGENNVLVEYGDMVLDLDLRFRVHALMTWLQAQRIPGLRELTPGIRSLQVHYDNQALPQRLVLDLLRAAERELPAIDDMEVPTRTVHLPVSWDDPACRLAIDKYMQTVRADAPWCPSNLEFIRRINGLDSIEEVRRIFFDARYLVMGLGDVYLGAPVATPLDPRHRLVTTKYNPARTWTPENAVGIGGAYLCVYGMEGPGGYQFVGRTLQMWNAWNRTAEFADGRPWLLRFFDQLRFFPVSHEELERIREDFPRGRYRLRIDEDVFRLRDYRRFLADNAAGIAAFKARQQAAFEAERTRWAAAGQDVAGAAEPEPPPPAQLADDERAVASAVPGSLWKVLVEPGQAVAAGDPIAIVESMKMEISVNSPRAGTVRRVECGPGQAVAPGQALVVLAVEE
ncbi:urea carboxylase [Pseudoxanthomonas suwonensis]|uniref:Biotin carboxylase n=1 Tax=Pseudoxanthomonas suwonensis TaxID=314722 RepID=A0A0E3UMV5_9GAMM|nr:urea carboxylase [Pseudoxanthomonas suwonensis]AKC86405.1 urea carboxylase [Pseudoxanthomonas suwonensis]